MAACATETGNQVLGGGDQTGGADASGGMVTAGSSTAAGAATNAGTSQGGGGNSGTTGGAGTGGLPSGTGGLPSGTGGAMGGGGAGGGGAGGAGGATGNDACPDDANKTAPGKCGCGVPDDPNNGASCVPLQNAIVHRYSFEVDAKDSVGSAHGALKGGATISGGALNLAGAKSGQYLDLPNGILSALTNVTIEAYVTWTGSAGGDWQRIFDFGSSDMAEDTPGTGNKYLFLSARKFRACYTSATPKSEIFTDASVTFPDAQAAQVAVVVNSADKTLSLFLDGSNVGSTVLNLPLSAINDVNNWIGRSQYVNDDYFGGKIDEFRIYNAALTPAQLETSKKMGENTTYLKK